jgi:hypothetical protein
MYFLKTGSLKPVRPVYYWFQFQFRLDPRPVLDSNVWYRFGDVALFKTLKAWQLISDEIHCDFDSPHNIWDLAARSIWMHRLDSEQIGLTTYFKERDW